MLVDKRLLLESLPFSHAHMPLHMSQPRFWILKEYLPCLPSALLMACMHTHSCYTLAKSHCCVIESSFPPRCLDFMSPDVCVSPHAQLPSVVEQASGLINRVTSSCARIFSSLAKSLLSPIMVINQCASIMFPLSAMGFP